MKKKKIIKRDVSSALQSILTDQEMAYNALWESLPLNQRKLISAIAKFGGAGIQSAEFIKNAELSSSSSVQTAKKGLLNKDLLDRENGNYFITDVFLKEWILRG